MARLLTEARGREKASLKEEEEKEAKEDEELEEKKEKEQVKDKDEMTMGGDDGRKANKGLLVHGLKGRKPKLSEEKKEEILTEDTVRYVDKFTSCGKFCAIFEKVTTSDAIFWKKLYYSL